MTSSTCTWATTGRTTSCSTAPPLARTWKSPTARQSPPQDTPTHTAVADFDGDGWQDLYVTNFGQQNNQLFYGTATGAHVESTDSVAVTTTGGSTGLSLHTAILDANQDGHLDLYVCKDSVPNQLFLGTSVRIHACTDACMHTCTHARLRTYTNRRMHTSTNAYTYLRIHCTQARMHVCTHA